MQDYAEYKREFMMNWTRKVSSAAGVAQGRGKRGTKKLEKLLEELSDEDVDSFRTRWMRWKAGQQIPSYSSFKKIHERALEIGYLGQPTTLRAMRERCMMMREGEWEFWRRYEANPAFNLDNEERKQELRERLAVLEQEAAAIRQALGILKE